ncbi:tRNA lysidine(34) synthetase TilS [Horticoccus sp. 23ND18S-11]|uniref:tRNA lysidine(34) synthetase TilS n=1 Tax=Horticoccus sp. 23ND18S-11 TaxID=3391832 RepID=UPI0039C97126
MAKSISASSKSAKALTAIAARLAALIPRDRLDPAVLAWVASAPPQRVWSVAFSGGADSLALLLLLWAHWPQRRRRLQALHFNHRLRGADSRADAAFCRRVARGLGITFIAGSWRAAKPDASEAAARVARMTFIERHGGTVWFGHQQDDVAETMLMRLARGSGAGGLAAPRPVHVHPLGRVHLRPLLPLKKTEIVRALCAAGATWCEDASNPGDRYFRNRVRSAVIPAWVEAAQRDALAGAARSRVLLEEDDVALEAWLDELQPLRSPGVLALAPLQGKPRALLRRALHRWLAGQPRAGEVSRAAFDALLNALASGRPTRHSLGRHGFAVIDRASLRFQPMGKAGRNFHRSAN